MGKLWCYIKCWIFGDCALNNLSSVVYELTYRSESSTDAVWEVDYGYISTGIAQAFDSFFDIVIRNQPQAMRHALLKKFLVDDLTQHKVYRNVGRFEMYGETYNTRINIIGKNCMGKWIKLTTYATETG